MRKTVLAIILCGIMILGLTGCDKKMEAITINVTYKDKTDTVEIEVDKVLKYTILGTEYEFKMTDITDEQVNIEVNKYGLTDSTSLLAKDKEFVIKKGEALELHTQTTDYQERIVFEY